MPTRSSQRAPAADDAHTGLVVSFAVCSASVAYVAVRAGSLPWQLGRLAAITAITGVVVQVLRRSPPLVRALIAVLTGLLATAVGVGIGLSHLIKVGWSATTVAGVTSLIAGLAQFAGGNVLLLRKARLWRWIIVLPATLGALTLVCWTLGQAVAATNVPRTEVGSTTPSDHGLSYRAVEFSTTDGVTLSGWYIPPANGAAVILLHGAGSTRSNVLDHATVLARHGFGVLLFDARGHGRSSGQAMDFGWYGDLDTTAAVTFLEEQAEVVGMIGAVGLSMGGEVAIGAAAADPRIRGVVAEGATGRVASDKAWFSDQYGLRGWLQEHVERVTYGLTDLLTSASPPGSLRSAASEMAPRPLFLIAAGGVPDEGHAAAAIRAAAPDSVTIWEVPGTGHTDALETHAKEWDQKIVAFLASALGVAGPPR